MKGFTEHTFVPKYAALFNSPVHDFRLYLFLLRHGSKRQVGSQLILAVIQDIPFIDGIQSQHVAA